MTARQSFNLEIRHPGAAPGADCWVLLPDLAPRQLQAKKTKAPAGATAQDLVWLRDRLLFAYLAPTGYREPEGPEPVTTWVVVEEQKPLRDAFPRGRAAELGECPLEGAEAPGRLPFDYVASLARDTTRVTCSETRPKKKSSIPLGSTAFEDAHLVRTVGTLAPELSRWIRYAYADSLEWDDEAGCVVVLWDRVQPQLGKLQGKSLQRAKGLAHLAVQEHKVIKNTGLQRYDGPALARLLGIKDSNFREHWRARWDAMQSVLDSLDTEALEALWKEFNQRKP